VKFPVGQYLKTPALQEFFTDGELLAAPDDQVPAAGKLRRGPGDPAGANCGLPQLHWQLPKFHCQDPFSQGQMAAEDCDPPIGNWQMATEDWQVTIDMGELAIKHWQVALEHWHFAIGDWWEVFHEKH
jgi:hypothetical protein